MMLEFDIAAAAPAWFGPDHVDREAIRAVFGQMFALRAPELLPEYEARELSYLASGFDSDGWGVVQAVRDSGEAVAQCRCHWSSLLVPPAGTEVPE